MIGTIMKSRIKSKTRRTSGDVAFTIINYLIFGIITVICIYPFYYILINSISDNHQSALGNVIFLPLGIHFDNYIEVMKLKGIGQAAFISVSRTVLGTFCSVFASAILGYLFTKKEMWGRSFWYRFIVVTMYFNAGIIPWFIVMFNLGMMNNFWAYILPGIVSPFFILLVKTYVESIPPSLEESAALDGAGFFIVLTRIIMPLIIPILATITIFAAVGQWNYFIDTLFLMTKKDNWTLQFILYNYLSNSTSLSTLLKSAQGNTIGADVARLQTATSVRMTITIVVVFPVLMVYPIFQRFFIKGILIGAVKG
jgi:putative aldouronate transport system permease protein